MQKVTVDFNRRVLSSIHLIPHDGTAEEGAMQTDLVRAPGERMEFEQGVMAELFERLVFADRFAPLARRQDGHLLAVAGVAADGGFHAACGRGGAPSTRAR